MFDDGRSLVKRKKAITVIAITCVLLAVLVAICIGSTHHIFNFYNEKDFANSLEEKDYEKTVTIYNAIIAGDEQKENQHNPEIEQAIDGIITSWSKGSISCDDAINELRSFKKIDNQNLLTEVNNKIRFVTVETEGDASFAEAEKQFNKSDYYQALVALSEIDPSYSQYSFVEVFRGECETILLTLISTPTSREEYAECEEKIDLYLSIDDADCFKARKAELEAQRDDFNNAAPYLEKAERDFDNGKYRDSFGRLENGLKAFPDNIFIKGMLDEYHNVYIAGTAQDVSDCIKREQYAEAQKIMDNAIEVYDCDEFDDILVYIKECKNPVYRAKNNVVERFAELKNKFSSGEVDVEKVRREAGVYVTKSGKKFLLGDYDNEEITLLSVSGEVATSLVGADIAADVRDLSYDITHWGEEEYFALCLATDIVAFIPVVGTIKYLKYSKEAGKGAKRGAKAAKDLLGGSTPAAKTVNKIIDNSTSISKNAAQSAVITKVSLEHLDNAKRYKKTLAIRKGLKYKSRDEVATYIHEYHDLPSNFITKEEAKLLKREKEVTTQNVNPSQYSPGKQIGGDIFRNKGTEDNGWKSVLPTDKKYKECDVDYYDETRGTRRIVFADDYSAIYYTPDHYNTFYKFTESGKWEKYN